METPHTSPNHVEAPVKTERTPENQEVLEQVLSLENINEIRDYQNDIYSSTRDRLQSEGTPWAEAASTADRFAQDFYDEQISKIALKGLEASDYNSVQQMLEPYSLVKMGSEEWSLGLTNDLNGDERAPSGQSRFASEAADLLHPVSETAADQDLDQTSEDEEAEELPVETKVLDEVSSEEKQPVATPEKIYDKAQLVQRRSYLSRLAAKRSNRLFGGKNEKYEQAEAEYNEEVIRSIKEELQDMLDDPDVTEEAKRQHVTARIFEEQANLREATIEKIENTPVRKFIGWMNKGGVATRIAKGAGIGIAAGVVAGLAGGVVGAGAVGVGVAAGITTAARFARGFAKAHGKKGEGMQSIDAAEAEQLTVDVADATTKETTLDEHFDIAQTAAQNTFEKDTKVEQRRLRQSARYGLATAALGAVVGGTTAQLIQDSGALNWLGDVANAANGSELTQAEIDAAEAQAILDRASVPIELQAPGADVELDANFVIESGEGGISFFEGLGLTEAQWYEAQPELAAKFPNEFLSDGTLNNAGQLSEEAQSFIKTRFSL